MSVEKSTKTIKHPKTGKTLYNESVGEQELIKVRYLIGSYKGVVEEVPELRGKRLIKAGKAESAEKAGLTSTEDKQRIDTLKKDETGKEETKDKGA